jgi:PAS domain-containing protein
VAEQERLIDTMFSQTTDAIVLVDPETLGFVTFNANAWQGLGHSREAFARLRVMDMQAEMDEREIRATVARALAGETLRARPVTATPGRLQLVDRRCARSSMPSGR